MPEIPTQPQPTSNQKSINWKRILIVAVIGAVVIGLGVLVFLILQPKDEATSTVTSKKVTPSAKISTPSAKKDEPADWKIYSSKSIGFQIKYPLEVEIESGASLATNRFGPSGIDAVQFDIWGPIQKEQTEFNDGMRLVIGLIENPEQLPTKDFADRDSNPSFNSDVTKRFSFEKVLIDNKESYTAVYESYPLEIKHTVIYLPAKKPDQIIQASAIFLGEKENDYNNIYELMISNFKFLD